jgi:membrane protein YqaA with SNARE-associated domain
VFLINNNYVQFIKCGILYHRGGFMELADRLNILGTEITFFGDGLAVLAARMEAELKQEDNEEKQKQMEEEADELNKFSNWFVLLGDFISALAAEVEAKENIEEINSNETKREATQLNILSSWVIVIGDALAVQAQALEEISKNDTTVP